MLCAVLIAQLLLGSMPAGCARPELHMNMVTFGRAAGAGAGDLAAWGWVCGDGVIGWLGVLAGAVDDRCIGGHVIAWFGERTALAQ